MIVTNLKYTIKWPEGAELKLDERSINEIRKSLEIQFKYIIYNQPGFKFFHSIGNTNFFQAFKTNDGIDFGVGHVYWDRNAEDNIYYHTDGEVNKQKGGWRFRWLPSGCYDPIGAQNIISEKGYKIIALEVNKRMQKALKSNVEVHGKEPVEEQVQVKSLEDVPKHLLN
jgi:hypothetical protein